MADCYVPPVSAPQCPPYKAVYTAMEYSPINVLRGRAKSSEENGSLENVIRNNMNLARRLSRQELMKQPTPSLSRMAPVIDEYGVNDDVDDYSYVAPRHPHALAKRDAGLLTMPKALGVQVSRGEESLSSFKDTS